MVDRIRFGGAALLLLTGLSAPSFAQPAPQPRLWEIDYGERRCALMRLLPGDHPATFSVRIIPGNQSPELHLLDPALRDLSFPGVQPVDITFTPSGLRLRGLGSMTHLDSAGGRVL